MQVYVYGGADDSFRSGDGEWTGNGEADGKEYKVAKEGAGAGGYDAECLWQSVEGGDNEQGQNGLKGYRSLFLRVVIGHRMSLIATMRTTFSHPLRATAMGVLHQSRGKGYAASRSLDGMTTASRVAKQPEESTAFEPMHDVAQRPQFGGLAGELGVTSAGVPIQAKMRVGAAGDRYEQEADRLAPQIVQQINAPGFGEEPRDSQAEIQEDAPLKQLQALRPTLQLKGESSGGVVSPAIESAIASARGGGQPLETELQERFGQAMGADFSSVRVHTDVQSDELNQILNARAFTSHNHMFFRRGEYQPESLGGQRLLAHELSHVLQQQKTNFDLVQRDAKRAYEHLKGLASPSVKRGIKKELFRKVIRQPAFNKIGSPEQLEARYTYPEIVAMFELEESEQRALRELWDWKDPIKLKKDDLLIPQPIGDRKHYSGLKQLHTLKETAPDLAADFEKSLREEYESERAKASKAVGGKLEGRYFDWRGRRYALTDDYDTRGVKHYEDGSAVSASVVGRVTHAVTPKEGRGEKMKQALRTAAYDIQQPDSAAGRKVVGGIMNGAAFISSFWNPTIAYVLQGAAATVEKKFESWAQGQINATTTAATKSVLGDEIKKII